MTQTNSLPNPIPLSSQAARRPKNLLRGSAAMLGLCLLIAVINLFEPGSDGFALLVAIAGSSMVAIVLPSPETRPFLALFWSALSFALALSLTMLTPNLLVGLAWIMGALGLWAGLCQSPLSRSI